MARTFHLDRRAFLKGIGGATLALPVLDAMGPELHAGRPGDSRDTLAFLWEGTGRTVGQGDVGPPKMDGD